MALDSVGGRYMESSAEFIRNRGRDVWEAAPKERSGSDRVSEQGENDTIALVVAGEPCSLSLSCRRNGRCGD